MKYVSVIFFALLAYMSQASAQNIIKCYETNSIIADIIKSEEKNLGIYIDSWKESTGQKPTNAFEFAVAVGKGAAARTALEYNFKVLPSLIRDGRARNCANSSDYDAQERYVVEAMRTVDKIPNIRDWPRSR